MTEKEKEHLVPLPEGHEQRPFVLVWAEKAAVDKLKAKNLTFSESVGGLEAKVLGESESFETTGGPQNEGADTTITF